MRKIKLTSKDKIAQVINKLQPMWIDVFDAPFLEKAQVAKSTERNNAFGILMNEKFIVLKKDRDLPNPPVYSISDIYVNETAADISSLLIYRLGHPLVRNKPKIFIAD